MQNMIFLPPSESWDDRCLTLLSSSSPTLEIKYSKWILTKQLLISVKKCFYFNVTTVRHPFPQAVQMHWLLQSPVPVPQRVKYHELNIIINLVVYIWTTFHWWAYHSSTPYANILSKHMTFQLVRSLYYKCATKQRL